MIKQQFPIYENMINSEFRVEHSRQRTLTYGSNIYHVIQNHTMGQDYIVYETGSKAKAAAVAEYLGLVAEQAMLDQYRTPEIRGTFTPRSIK